MTDIRAIGARYAEAWTSHAADAVASFYESDGRITINGGEPLVGRSAIADMAKGFYTAFPDLVVRMDDVRRAGDHAIFVWTLEGTHAETDNFVQVGGWEEWLLSGDLLVRESLGRYDVAEYERQVAHGA
jgi:uncharacterized protein (TIGR02246 family)